MEKLISVINQTPMKVIAETKSEAYIFEPHYTERNVLDLTLEEITYIHKNTNLFKYGYLTVEDDLKKEVFESIGFNKYKDVLSVDEIIDALENPNGEKLSKLLTVKSLQVFDRIYKELVGLLSRPNDISNRVIKLIEFRYDELFKGILDTTISVEETSVQKPQSNTELQNRIKELEDTISKLNLEDEKKNTRKSKKTETDEK